MSVFGIFIPDSPQVHIDYLHAFAEGLAKRRYKFRLYALEDGYQPCDIAVTFGVAKKRTPRGRAIKQVLQTHADSNKKARNLVIELGFVHRDRYCMVGWGGLNGRADYCNEQSDGRRWRDLNVELAPWRDDGQHIVLCGQVPWDASVQHTDHGRWCRETAIRLREHSDREIIFRPHPLQPTAVDMSGAPVVFSQNKTLEQDMRNAWAVVTFNSNAGVEATIGGVPAFVCDEGAMGYGLLNTDLSKIETPEMPDRTQWLHDLAYTQWTMREMTQGIVVKHLWEKNLPLWDRLQRFFMKREPVGHFTTGNTPTASEPRKAA